MSKSFYVVLFNSEDKEVSDLLEVSGPGDEEDFKKAWYKAVENVKKTNPEEWYFSDVIGILGMKRHKVEPWIIKSIPYTEVAS